MSRPFHTSKYHCYTLSRPFKLFFILLTVPAVTYLLLSSTAGRSTPTPHRRSTATNDTRVPLDLFVMSKCPDAAFCERVMDDVLSEVGDIVNLSVNYIASVDSTSQYGARCPHGDGECLGDIQQLCVKKYYHDPNHWFQFVLCQNKRQFSIPLESLAESCAGQYDIDWTATSPVRKCIDGPEGAELLQESAKAKDKLGVTKSCTIVLNGTPRCIHDGSWYSCPGGHNVKDFVRDICTEYGHNNQAPDACSNPLEEPRFEIGMESIDVEKPNSLLVQGSQPNFKY